MFALPQPIQTEVFAEVPQSLRKAGVPAERIAAGRGAPAAGCFLEGPSFDRAGNLYFVDNTYGRIFRASPQRKVEVVAEYDGEPNGLRIHKDGRIFVADFKNGIMLLDPASGKVTPVVSRYQTEHFKGVNDLVFASNGDLYFTDQGQTDLVNPTGRVYCLTAAGQLRCIADNAPSPNGLVLNLEENVLYLAVTRANAVWRLPFTPSGMVARMGLFIQLSGGRGPDGMALDDSGGLVVAHPDMGAVWIFNHRGEPLYRVQSCRSDIVTNVAFGGPDRKTIYITDSGSGCILMARVPTAGRVLYSHM
ncbi:MAG: SMP-30/gluconolactonase/LRE family protein [Betaproteobacteria bacterium]|nr:SMP-30/gluconolactonase/LRE family protein [Betaproteobacteria bacterium]